MSFCGRSARNVDETYFRVRLRRTFTATCNYRKLFNRQQKKILHIFSRSSLLRICLHVLRRMHLQLGILVIFLLTIAKAVEDDAVEKIALDPSRLDALGWTDAHHVSYGTFVTVNTKHHKKVAISAQDAPAFLRDATNDFLCLQNDFGQTALHLAVRQDNIPVVSFLVERRDLPCLDLGNRDGDTFLHYAAAWGRSKAARLLLHGGANPSPRNQQGHTPPEDARNFGNEEVVSVIRDFIENTVSEL
jgi:ankyrin repeat protein